MKVFLNCKNYRVEMLPHRWAPRVFKIAGAIILFILSLSLVSENPLAQSGAPSVFRPGKAPKKQKNLTQPITYYFSDCVQEWKPSMWLLDSLGDTLQRVSSRPGFASWASDYTRMVCIDPNSKLKILALNKAKGGIIIDLPKGLKPDYPAWKPGADRIAFTAKQDRSVRQLYLVNAEKDGGSLEQITNDKSGVMFPAWSPDGKTILYSHMTTDTGMYTLDLASGESKPLPISDSLHFIQAVWSPDGKMLALTCLNNGNIYSYDLETKKLKNLTVIGAVDSPFMFPRFAERGKFIICVGKKFGSETFEIYRLPPTGGALIRITDATDNLSHIYAAPCW